MTIYRRYFEIKDAKTLDAINEIMVVREEYLDALIVIQKEAGADNAQTYNRSLLFAGFGFDCNPDKEHWKKSKGLWLPKLKSKEGRALNDRIESLTKPETFSALLKSHGLPTDFSDGIMEGLTLHYSSICGSKENGWFVSVPWKDVDPAEFDKEESSECPSLLLLLKWMTLPAEWVEVKEWQVLKATTS